MSRANHARGLAATRPHRPPDLVPWHQHALRPDQSQRSSLPCPAPTTYFIPKSENPPPAENTAEDGRSLRFPAPATASGRAGTTVTIKYNGDGFQGKVKSTRASCIANRTVKVYKQRGSVQDPSTDQKLYTDTSDSTGRWDTGTSGQVHGKFYARARGTTRC